MISATLLMGPTSAASGSPPSSPSAPSPPAFYIINFYLYNPYLLRGSLYLINVGLETGSDVTVVVDLFQLQEVCELESIRLLVLEQV
jgi:hypothetical protein